MASMIGRILLLCLFFSCVLSQCPPAQMILPCNCSDVVFPLVECGHIYEMQVLQEVFERSADRNFSSFALYESSLQYLLAYALTSKHFSTLMIVNSTLEALFDDHPAEENEVEMVILNNVRFRRGIGWNLFKNLKQLKLVQTEGTEIKSLGKSFVENVSPELTNLLLPNGKVKKIHPNAFQKLEKLFDIEITDSFVKELTRSMFATPAALETINFSGNQIESLPDDIFSEMPSLREIRLNDNKISALTQDIFGDVFGQLSTLELNNNPLKCDCSVQWYVNNDAKSKAEGRCVYPDDKKGRDIQDLTSSDFKYC